MGPLKKRYDENGVAGEPFCPVEQDIRDLIHAIDILAGKFDALVESHKTAFRWLLAAIIIIAFGNSKLAENFFNFFSK